LTNVSERKCPLPVEMLGGWHKKAVEQFRKLPGAGKEEDDTIRHLFQLFGGPAIHSHQENGPSQ
jgi:hypothetical protein